MDIPGQCNIEEADESLENSAFSPLFRSVLTPTSLPPYLDSSLVYSPTTPDFDSGHLAPYSTVTRGIHSENIRGHMPMGYGGPNQPSGQSLLSPSGSADYWPGQGWGGGRSGLESALPRENMASQEQQQFSERHSALRVQPGDFVVEIGEVDAQGGLEQPYELGQDVQEAVSSTSCQCESPYRVNADEDVKYKPQMRSSTTAANLESGGVNPRQTHNSIEQNYRKRLKDAYQELLDALPLEERHSYMRSRPSKPELLEMARQRILMLEREQASLEQDQQALKANMERVEGHLRRM